MKAIADTMGVSRSHLMERMKPQTKLVPCRYNKADDAWLLLTRHTGKRPQLAHEDKVVTLRSNLRWCSDGFEISCWNGQVVRVAFALDCCDREIISHVATTGGITGEMVRDLMIESVEARFGPIARLPHAVEWFSDNGSCYTATETISFAKDMGFISCFTPVRSPQSNGMAEAFVKTFKRDYV